MSWLFKNPVVLMKEIMPWLFKDPIVTVTWFNSDHAQSNSKKWSKNIKLPQMIFSWKTTYRWPFLLSKNKKIKLRADPKLCGSTIFGPKWPNCLEEDFFQKNYWYNFHVSLGPFQAILTVNPELWGCTILGPEWSICPKQVCFFLEKPLIEFRCTCYPLLLCKI